MSDEFTPPPGAQPTEPVGSGTPAPALPPPALPPTGLTTYDILPAAVDPPEAQRRSGPGVGVVVAVLAVVLALLVSGVVITVKFLSGGGTQPEQVLPSTAFAFAKIDLDPSAGQKLDAVRFLRKFPTLKGKVSEDKDLRQALFEGVAQDGTLAGVDYQRDVEPWLGERVGVAVLPSASGAAAPDVVVALSVTDEGKARAGLARLVTAAAGKSGKPAGYVFRDGFALLAESQATAKAADAAAQKSDLASSTRFDTDIKGLGDNGIATFWADADAAQKHLAGAFGAATGLGVLGTGSLGKGGRVAFALRFDGADVLEIAGRTTGVSTLTAPKNPTKGLAQLPDSTLAAVGIAGLDGMVDPLWQQLRTTATAGGASDDFDASVDRVKAQFGLDLPADLKTLLGHDLLVALDKNGLADGDIAVGARVRTDPAKGSALAAKLVAALKSQGVPFAMTQARTDDGYVVASSREQVARMQQTGSLGSRADFRKALPDIASAHVAVWVDIDGIAKLFDERSNSAKSLEVLDGLGVTASLAGDTATYRLRLVAH